jgi:hypothetical protein
MVFHHARPASRTAKAGRLVAGKAAALVVVGLAALVGPQAEALAQRPIHYFNRGGLPPGAIGSQQLLRGGPLPNYFQPAEIEAPEGASISLAVDGRFGESRPGSIKIGALIGQVYYFRVTGIRLNQGFEVYPTIEVINRLYPPPGQEARFPIPIQITQEDAELALSGQFVTRVIYLENPNTALPVQQDPKRQRYFEVHPNDDPLEVADRLGRPMAILRLGSRMPDSSDSSFSLGDRGAPLLLFPPSAEPLPAAKPAEPAAPVVPAPPENPAAPEAVPPEAAPPEEAAIPSAAKRSGVRLATGIFKLREPEPKKTRGQE